MEGPPGARRDAVQSALSSLAAKEPDLRKAPAHRGRWARSFATAAYRLALARTPDEKGLLHHADLLEAQPRDRAKVLATLQGAPSAYPLAPAPKVPEEIHLGRSTPREVLRMLHELKARVHDLDQTGRRRDVYLAEVLAAVEAVREALPEQVDAALHRSALRRGQEAADRAVAHLTSARSFSVGSADGVTVVDVARLLVAVPGSAWELGARLALRGDPQTGITEHVAAVLACEDEVVAPSVEAADPAVLVDLGAGADAGLAALLAARAGHRVHVVEADERARELIARSFALNDLEPAGVHADVAAVDEAVDAVRLHDDTDLAARLGALPRTADGVRAWCPAPARPTVAGWAAQGVTGVPGAWELTRA